MCSHARRKQIIPKSSDSGAGSLQAGKANPYHSHVSASKMSCLHSQSGRGPVKVSMVPRDWLVSLRNDAISRAHQGLQWAYHLIIIWPDKHHIVTVMDECDILWDVRKFRSLPTIL